MTNATKTLKFSTPGMGIGLAADWFTVNGKRVWVSFMSASEGRGQRRKWTVTASHYQAEGKPLHCQATLANAFRYEAADIALSELSAFI